MRRCVHACLIALLACVPSFPGLAAADDTSAGVALLSGNFTLLTYNVAGLPVLVSQSEPVTNTPLIGGLLNLYDVAVVQEDFTYHGALSAAATHAYRTEPLNPSDKVGIGDGLSFFSRFSFGNFERVAWRACNGKLSDGSDCLTAKGFAVATQMIDKGVEIDLYDVHMDSGGAPADVRARALQAEQLLAYMAQHSPNRAVIVAGDTNMGHDSEQVLKGFLERAGLTDACRSLGCSEPDRIDRVMYRGSRGLALRAERLVVDDRFVRPDGRDLSDHKAVGVVLRWTRLGQLTATDHVEKPRRKSRAKTTG
jgi:endonuclease/exonuclease/phosphatase family metal-dependent hydrolase